MKKIRLMCNYCVYLTFTLQNPTDDVSEELIASQGFLREEAFHRILYALAGFLGGFFLLGLIWEFTISKLLGSKL